MPYCLKLDTLTRVAKHQKRRKRKIVEATAQRLDKLAKELDQASKEAKAVADVVRNDLAVALTETRLETTDTPKKKGD